MLSEEIQKKIEKKIFSDITSNYTGGRIENYAPTGLTRLFCNQPDRLAVMFHEQSKLQEKHCVTELCEGNLIMQQHYIDKMLLAIHEEAVEIARETISKHTAMPFGWKNSAEYNEEKYKEEIIDLWHFVMNLWLITGATDQEFFEMYLDKNNINHERQESNY